MSFTIEVTPVSDNEDISFCNLELIHSGCTSGSIKKHRNQVTNIYSLTCGCGLEVSFLDEYTGPEAIKWTAIKEEQREIDKKDYYSNRDGPFLVAPRTRDLA